MKRIILAILGAVIFGKLFPIVLLALLLIGGALMIKAAVEEGKQL